MEVKIINNDNINLNSIDDTAIRVKALILNSNNEILLGYSYGTYQFPGGHIENDEELIPALNREIREETGLDFGLNGKEVEPFYAIKHYSSNYRGTGKNRENIIYYYLFYTDTPFNKENSNLDPIEIEGDYTLKYVNFDEVEDLLIKSIPDNDINKIIVDEMLEVINIVKTRSVIE